MLLPRLANCNLLQRQFRVRIGTDADIDVCDRIARAQERRWKSSLGWIAKRDYADFHVAMLDGDIVGFVLFHRALRGEQTGWNLVEGLAVDERYEGLGIGRNLLYSVECPVRLRCPQYVNSGQPNKANHFYDRCGLQLAGTEEHYRGGEKRGQTRPNPLNVWELPILPILVMGSNAEMPVVARATGWAYGTREVEKPQDWPYQVDIDLGSAEGDWRAYDWDGYMCKIRRWRPFAALVVDYFERDQREVMLRQVDDLRCAGVVRVLVCPKFHGAVQDIPIDCVVAISIPSRYAGFVPHDDELSGRKLHLLGGSPTKWFGSHSGRKNRESVGYISKLLSAGAQIVSVDGNSHEAAAQTGTYWSQEHRYKRPADGRRFIFGNRFNTLVVSGNNIRRDLHESVTWKSHLTLFG